MQIVCPNCTTAYEVDAGALGAGRSVRCVRCQTVWHADPTQQPAAAAALEPAMAGGEEDLSAWGLTPEADAEPASNDAVADVGEATEESDPGADLIGQERGDDALELAALGQSVPVDVADAPPLVPDDGAASAGEEAHEDVESVAARRAASEKAGRGFSLLRPNGLTAALVLGAIVGGLVAWRVDVVRTLPQTGSFFSLLGMPVNLRGLAIVDVKTTREIHDNVSVLVVEGSIANIAKTPLEVPRLRFAVRSERHAELYAWTVLPGRTILSAGDRIPFRSRLASPPAEGREVSVRFFNRRDLAAGLR
jgi:predicted Zn finger-like uncharacterized protein